MPVILRIAKTAFSKIRSYLVRDRDPLYTKHFDSIVESSGIETIKTSVCAPDMNAYAERFVQTLKHECLNKMVFTSQEQLEYAVSEFMTYYHKERPHQGLGGAIIDPWPQDDDGEIVEFPSDWVACSSPTAESRERLNGQ